jgi:hypothetical protein
MMATAPVTSQLGHRRLSFGDFQDNVQVILVDEHGLLLTSPWLGPWVRKVMKTAYFYIGSLSHAMGIVLYIVRSTEPPTCIHPIQHHT